MRQIVFLVCILVAVHSLPLAEDKISENTAIAPRNADVHIGFFKEEGGSLYSIALKHYLRTNATLFDLIPTITDIRQIDDNQKITIPLITPESYVKKLSNGSYRVHIGTFETHELATSYSKKVNETERQFFIEPQNVSFKDTWYRLMMGDFGNKIDTLQTVKLLKEKKLIYISPQYNDYTEIVRKVISSPEGKEEHVFYRGEKEVARQMLDEDENIIKTVGEIPDGIIREYYERGGVKAEHNYKSNKLEGMSKVYYENGNLNFKCNYIDGKKEGVCKLYYKNGGTKYAYEYKTGKLDGLVKKYYRNSKLASEWHYRDGKREGITKSYNKNGSLKTEWNYKNDKLDGIARIFYDKGEIQYIETYKKGYKINRKAYDKRGKFEFEQDYPYEEMDEKKKN
jgi:antitoxin component YwqK of YwqJK toxin-antitoxin module